MGKGQWFSELGQLHPPYRPRSSCGQRPASTRRPNERESRATSQAIHKRLSRADPLGDDFKLSDVLADGLQRCFSILARGVLVDPSRGVVYIAKLAC